MADSLLSRLRSDLASGKGFAFLGRRRKMSAEEACDLCAFLEEIQDVRPLIDTTNRSPYDTLLYPLVMAFQTEMDQAACDVVHRVGMAQLLRICDLALAEPSTPAHPLTMMVKMFVMYAYEPAMERVPAIVRRFPDEYMFSPAFDMLADERHPHGPRMIELLRDPLPEGFSAVLTLDLANALARQNRLQRHPFNSPTGIAKLEAWLTSKDGGEFSYAHSAAASLPFLAEPARGRLAALAMDHVDPKVQLEAAWASAYLGSDAGLRFLIRMTENVQVSLMAQRYLHELGRAELIPPGAAEPDFRAMAEMSEWLAHPQEFGEPPTEIELYDSRTLFWPPTEDTRQLWLFRYRYAGHKENGEDDVGIGMVGSVTFALFGETTGDLSPEDVYGLHCCWELECNGDTRAPEKRTATAGRQLLGL
jgi:hypothetical protein